MLFNSTGFLLSFLPIFLLVYKLTPNRFKNIPLLIGSIVFYSVGEPKYLIVFGISLIINYLVGLRLDPVAQEKRIKNKKNPVGYEIRRKLLLLLAVTANTAVLLVYKIFAGDEGVPLGLSFYTFQMIGYLFDVYRGQEARETSLLCFSTYAMMFAKMSSGPITEYGQLREKLHKRKATMESIKAGLQLFTVGLALKVLVADKLGILWHDVEVIGYESLSTPLAWMAAVAFSCKLYFDFYGYSLMAIGVGRMLGFSLPPNFHSPYMATSVRDFYRKWHITLGKWFTKYVYIPFGGSRCSEIQTVRNLIIVWCLTSIWHGFGLNFLIWGMMLCALIIIERYWCKLGLNKPFQKGIGKIVPHLYIWTIIPVTWMCFAISDMQALQVYLGRMFGLVPGVQVSAGDWLRKLQDYWYLFLVAFILCTPILQKTFRKLRESILGSIILAVLFWICVWKIQTDGQNPFLYFKF